MDHLQLLKRLGMKPTPVRERVLALFYDSEQRHLAADDIYRELLQRDTHVALASIYRVLGQFEQAGVLQKLQLGESKALYELSGDMPNHGHLVSAVQGQVQEFHDPLIESRLAQIAQARGLRMTGYVLTVFADPAQQQGT